MGVLGLLEGGEAITAASLSRTLHPPPDAPADLADELVARGLLVRGSGGTLELTADGRRTAEQVMRRHRLAERLLLEVVGVPWSRVHVEADRWEHVISDDVEARLIEVLGNPTTCPHGNPLPGSPRDPDQDAAIALAEAPEGPVRVVRIAEELETDLDALELLEACGFVPGRDAEVAGRSGADVKVVGAVADAVIPPHVAGRSYVVPR